jgi:hypothetical protein
MRLDASTFTWLDGWNVEPVPDEDQRLHIGGRRQVPHHREARNVRHSRSSKPRLSGQQRNFDLSPDLEPFRLVGLIRDPTSVAGDVGIALVEGRPNQSRQRGAREVPGPDVVLLIAKIEGEAQAVRRESRY